MNILKNKLLSNTFHLYILTIVKMILPMITLPYLARVLSTDSYGLITYIKAWMQYAQLVIDFGFLLSATKMVVLYRDNPQKIGRVIGDTIIEKILLSAIALVILIIASTKINLLAENYKFCFLYYISVFLTIFLFDFLFRGMEEMEKLSIPLILSKSITTLLTFVFVKSDKDIVNIAYLEIIGNMVAVMISTIYVHKMGYKIYFSNWYKWISDIRMSFIYFLSNFSTTVFGALTTVISGIVLTKSDVAVWGLCMQFVNAVKSIYSPIINSLYPYMIKDRNIKLVNKINKIMLIPIGVGVFIILFFSKELINVVAGLKYFEVSILLKLLIPVFVFSFYSMMYGWPVLGAINMDKIATATTVASSILQIVLLGILIFLDKYNLVTLSISIGISEFSLFVFRYYVYKKNINLFIGGK